MTTAMREQVCIHYLCPFLHAGNLALIVAAQYMHRKFIVIYCVDAVEEEKSKLICRGLDFFSTYRVVVIITNPETVYVPGEREA